MNLQVHPVRSSLGSKYWMALTGLALIGFVLVHMSGNLLLFAGPDAINSYAQGLKARPPLLWAARLGLLVVFLIHLILGIRLAILNKRARPIAYHYEETVQASWASRHMFLTGMVLLAFIIYHLAHFTFGVVKIAHEQRGPTPSANSSPVTKNYLDLTEVKPVGGKKYEPRPDLTLDEAKARLNDPSVHQTYEDARHDVYSMVVSGFKNPVITGTYLVAMIFLWLHLWHGASSWFQSLGINHPLYNPFLRGFGPVLATIVLIGNCSMPLAVLLGLVK